MLATGTAFGFVFVEPLSTDPLTRELQIFKDIVAQKISDENRAWIEENCKNDKTCRKAAFNITNAYDVGVFYSGNEVDKERHQTIKNAYNNTFDSLVSCAKQVEAEIKNARTTEQARTALTVMCQEPIINFIHASCHYGGKAEIVCKQAEEKILSHPSTLIGAVMSVRTNK